MVIYREVTGLADEGRAPPPGLDQPFPNLAVVPPRPERPALTAREAVSAGLAADRERSRAPLAPAAEATTVPAPAAATGEPRIPGQPPPRPSLAAAPAVPWVEPDAVARPGRAAAPAGSGRHDSGSAAPAAPIVPDAAPAPPPPELLGPPPAPAPDLLAPAPPRLR